MTSKAQKTRDDGVNAMYAYCLRFFSELKALGVTNAIVSPGSRSTPLVLSAKQVGLDVVVHLDERVAAFHALGAAKATRIPSILICSSGTAAANYLPAVVEANHAATPMIICTADRPPELRQWGEGQTINQVGLYGNNVRWHYDLPVASEINESHARSTAFRAWSMSTSRLQGPVHLNWPFRKPLEPTQKLETPEASLSPKSSYQEEMPRSSSLVSLAKEYERGLITVGPNSLQDKELDALVAFSSDSGWPILADPCSQL
ncbi:MAG: 2-succinyl-5-enolpyruvyl-6-hydroxy-3-cyclohexene-1-carboxylic-acid synthase, partial [Actinomycetota bacterium]|nr:2-succinyl-5-enolpyruvyl-6-hydroxy-3-cyclohexene-1-carboxylic-acid synthase [Actinomycetota bacterium]